MPFRSPLPLPQKKNAGDRRAAAWVVLAATLLFAAMAAPFFVGRYYLTDDLGEFHLPLRAFYEQCLVQGDAFDWMPSLFCGFDLTGEGQAGTYHPLHWLLYRWLPLQAAFSLELLISYPVMMFGSYLLFRCHIIRRSAAWFGALIFTFSSFGLLHFIHPNAMAVVSHLPWLLLAAGSLVRTSQSRRIAGPVAAIGLLTGSQLLLGYPQYVWLSLLAECAYLTVLLRRRDNAVRASSLLHWLFAKACGVMIGGVQILSTWDALQQSTRQTASPGFLANGSLHPLNLVQLVAPYLFTTRVVGQNTHELGLYIGGVPIVLIAWMMFAKAGVPKLRRWFWTSLALAAVALLLATGEFTPLYRLTSRLPLVGSFRFSCRAIVLLELALAAAAAIAFSVLLRCGEKNIDPNRYSKRGLGLAFVGSIGVAELACLAWRDFVAPWPLVIAGPIIIVLAALAICAALRGYRWAIPALVLFTAADLGTYGLAQAVYRETASQAVLADSLSMLLPPGQAAGQRVMLESAGNQSLRQGNRMLLAGVSRVDGYAGLEPARQLNYCDAAALRAAGSRYSTGFDASPFEDIGWISLADPLPRAYFVRQTLASSNPARDINQIDLTSTALIESGSPIAMRPANSGTRDLGQVQVLADRPGRIEFATESSAEQLLVVTESYHRGWRAQVDGRNIPVLRANGDFLGCVVPVGKHRVNLEFSSPALQNGKMLTACGLCLLGISCIAGYCRRKAA